MPLLGSDEHDVESPADPPMLEPVVQNDTVGPLPDRLGYPFATAAGSDHRSAGVHLTMESDLVGAIAAHEHRGVPSPAPQPPDHPRTHGGLTRSPHRQVADADDR